MDNVTFDKILSIPRHAVLAKFDEMYPQGEKESAFKELCKWAYHVSNFLVIDVPVQNYADRHNEDLRERFDIAVEDFPTYLLFQTGSRPALRYTGKIEFRDISDWLREHEVSMPRLGAHFDFEQIVRQFVWTKMADAPLMSARKLVESAYSSDRKALMYVKVMEKAQAEGSGYIVNELLRVKTLLGSQISSSKRDELTDKLEVLSAFTKDMRRQEL